MGDKFRRLKLSVSNALGLSELSAGNKRFLHTHLNFIIFVTIPGVFINTFFFRQNGSITTVAVYNAICCFGAAVFMHLSAYISIKKSPVFIMRVGVILLNVFYMTILLLQSRAVYFMPLLGLLNAIANSFYWQSYSTLLQEFTDEASLNRSLSIIGICGAVVSLVIPALSGLAITGLRGSAGYTVIFILSFGFSLYTTYLTTRIPDFKLHVKPNIMHTYFKIFTTKSWLFMLLSETVRGMRDAAFPVFLSIVLFKFIENEAYIGLNTMICGLASAVSFYFAGRLIKENNRVRCVLISSGVLFILYLAVFLRVDATVIFILSVANSMLATYILNPSMAALFSMFKDVGEDANFPQLMAAHEMFLAVGRVIGFIVIIVLSYNTGVYVYAFLLLNLSAFLGALLLKLAENAHKRERMAALKQ